MPLTLHHLLIFIKHTGSIYKTVKVTSRISISHHHHTLLIFFVLLVVNFITGANEGYFSIQIHPDLTCHGVAEEYATALNTCIFEGYDSSNNLMMFKYANVTIYSDGSLSMSKVYYSDTSCSTFSYISSIDLPSCAIVNGRSYQFSFKTEIPEYATDGVFSM